MVFNSLNHLPDAVQAYNFGCMSRYEIAEPDQESVTIRIGGIDVHVKVDDGILVIDARHSLESPVSPSVFALDEDGSAGIIFKVAGSPMASSAICWR